MPDYGNINEPGARENFTTTTMKTYNGFTLEEMRAEVARELALRRRTYAKWVAAGTMTQADNDQHIGRLAAVLALIDDVEGNQ